MNDDFAFYLEPQLQRALHRWPVAGVQFFDIGSDFASVTAARREADVLLTEGQEGTWQWGRPDYNFGNRGNGNSTGGPRLGRLERRGAAGRLRHGGQRLHGLRRARRFLGDRLEGRHAGAEVPDRRLGVRRRVQLHRLQHQLAGLRRHRTRTSAAAIRARKASTPGDWAATTVRPTRRTRTARWRSSRSGDVHARRRQRHRPDGALQVHLRRGRSRHAGGGC